MERSLRLKYNYIFNNVSYILSVNNNASQDYQKFGLKGKIKWLPNSIDIFKPNPIVRREKWILHIHTYAKLNSTLPTIILRSIQTIVLSLNSKIKLGI